MPLIWSIFGIITCNGLTICQPERLEEDLVGGDPLRGVLGRRGIILDAVL